MPLQPVVVHQSSRRPLLRQALGRILILPRLVCGLDRWWAPHAGIIPGSATRLPLLECPADHVIDLERMGKPERVLREHSLLCNPRTPKAVLAGARPEALRELPRWVEGEHSQYQRLTVPAPSSNPTRT